eukprot:gb/GFBE01047541.1/.p1 GENE.gb/GFBE01047541.1/~~gb/GFBE01047541.1/.p1  ORF type:complete len:537 (+),score=99.43 gb/GFBE01047541.1/:1-1611(+)
MDMSAGPYPAIDCPRASALDCQGADAVQGLSDADAANDRLREQVEFLLSDANLNKDKQMRDLVEAGQDGWVDVSALALRVMQKAQRKNRWTRDPTEALHRALSSSTKLEVRCQEVPQVRRLQPFLRPPKADLRGMEERRKALEEAEVFFPLMSAAELEQLTVPIDAPPAQLRDVFNRYGCCLVTGVLSERECDSFEKLWQADLLNLIDPGAHAEPEVARTLTHVQQQGCSAWPASWAKPLGSRGCASQRSTPHGAFSWAARLHPQVRRVFAELFETHHNDLVVGQDCVFWAAKDTPEAASNVQWLHVDQNHRSGLTHLCAQGVLYVWPSTDERASSTVVWPGSHLSAYKKLMGDMHAVKKGRKALGSQSVRINSLEDADLRDDLATQAIAGSRRVPCPPGSLLLWDSRTIHQGWAGGPRLAQPVCWEPRNRRDEAARRRKLYMAATGIPSSHSSSEGRVHGMARAGAPKALKGTPSQPAMRLTVPYGVAPSREAAWRQMQDMLWPSSYPDRNCDNLTDAQCSAIQAVLREEVLEAL